MSKLGDLVRERREAMGLDQKALADVVGYSQPTISDIENGTTSSPRGWRRLAQFLDIPEEDFRILMVEASRDSGKTTRLSPAVRGALASGVALPRASEPSNENSSVRLGGPAPIVGRRDVPVYGKASAGDDGQFEFNGEVMGWEVRPPQLEGVAEAYVVYVGGISMYPRYRDGEAAWVNPNRPARKGDDVVVQLWPNDPDGNPSGFVKELVGLRGNKMVFWQHNPPQELEVDRKRVKSIHLIQWADR